MKKFLTAIFALAMVAALSACGDDSITLVVWESTGGPDEWIQQAGERFTELNPGINIEWVHVELGDATSQIMLDGPAGVGPDLFAAPHDRLGDLVYGQHIVQVNAAHIAHLAGGTRRAVSMHGNYWGFPVSAETYGLFYNRALVQNPPQTWEELITFSRQFNAANPGQFGFVMNVGDAYFTILFTSSNENMLFGPDGTDIVNTRINSPDSVRGMQLFHSLREILPVPSDDLDTGSVDALFQGGHAAMHITGPWNFSPFRNAGIDFGVTSLPALPGNTNPAMSFSGTRAMFISSFSDYPEEAALFAQFLVSEEMQRLRYDITGALPSMEMSLGGEFGDLATGILQQMPFAYPMPSIPQMGAYWEAMNSASANIWNGDGTNIQAELDAVHAIISAN